MRRRANPLICNPRGGRHLIVMNAFQQPFPQVMATQEAAPPDEPRIHLTPAEFHELKPASKQLRLDMKKYWTRYETMPLNLVKKHLEATRNEMPFLETGTSANATVSHVEDGPRRFFVQWKDQEDRLNLISFVLNARKLETLDTGTSLQGKLVAAERKGDFARAFIYQVVSKFRVKVYFLDWGEKLELEIDSLRKIPPEFADIGLLCFPACLNLELDKFGHEALTVARKLFYDQICSGQDLRCEIFDVKRINNEAAVHVVGLWKLTSMQGYELSKYIRDQVLSRRIPSPLSDNAFANRNFTDACRQIYMDSEIDIPPYVDREPKIMKMYRFVNIVSPSEFYLQHCSDGGIPKWYVDMQHFYKDSSRRAQLRIRTKELCKNRCYVWKDPGNNSWNRVRVVNFTSKIGPFTEARLWLMDRGKFVDGEMIDMMELCKDFVFGALAFRGFLCHISPRPGDIGGIDKSDQREWSENLVRVFKEMCRPDKLFVGVAASKETVSEEMQGIALDREAYGMILGEYANKENRGTLQAALTKAGLVMPTGLACGRHDLAYMLTKEPSYCRLDMERQLNLKVHVDLIKERIENASSQHFYELDEKEQRHLARGIQFKVGFIRMSRTISPDNFYIQMEDKLDTLYKMENDLGNIVENFPAVCGQNVVPGMICAGRALDDTIQPPWSRVIVIAVEEANDRALAIYIDNGDERFVKLSTLRVLPPYFNEIPPFCHRAHLDFSTIENLCMPTNITWEDDGCWRRYIDCWNTVGAIYYAWQLKPAGEHSLIHLDEFHQTLNFDQTSMTWFAGRMQKKKKYLPLKKLKDHSLTKQFFCSVGVNMVYECENADFPVITEPAWTLLKDIGEVVSIYD